MTSQTSLGNIDLLLLLLSLTGICYSSEDCSGVTGGYADGKCAQGFGVCCVVRSGSDRHLQEGNSRMTTFVNVMTTLCLTLQS